MAPITKFTSLLLAGAFFAQASLAADDSVPLALLANNNCGKDVSACVGADVEIVTEYVGEPYYLTINATATSTKLHTTTETSFVAVVETSTVGDVGICETVTTKTIATRQTIPVTRTSTKIEHRVTKSVTTSTATYIEYVSATSACIMEIGAIPTPGFPGQEPISNDEFLT